MRLFQERIEAMRVIWTEDEATYHGEFVNFDRILSWPKPLQRPHPPVLVGGGGPTVEDRVLAFGDAWFPNYAGVEMIERAAALRARAERPIDLQASTVPSDPKALDALAKGGFTRAVHTIPSSNLSVVEAAFEDWERAVSEFTGTP